MWDISVRVRTKRKIRRDISRDRKMNEISGKGGTLIRVGGEDYGAIKARKIEEDFYSNEFHMEIV